MGMRAPEPHDDPLQRRDRNVRLMPAQVTFEPHGEAGRTRPVLTHTGLRGRDDALGFGGGWHSHLAVLEKRLPEESVPNFRALQPQSELAVENALRQPLERLGG